MPDLVQTVDRSDLRHQQELSQAGDARASSLDSRLRTKSNSVKRNASSSSGPARRTGTFDITQRATSFSGSDMALFRQRRERNLMMFTSSSAATPTALKSDVDGGVDCHDSGNSSCNDSEINVQPADFARLPPNLRVRCQSLDVLDTVAETDTAATTTTSWQDSTASYLTQTSDATAAADSNDDSERTLCSSSSVSVLNEDSESTIQDVHESIVDTLNRNAANQTPVDHDMTSPRTLLQSHSVDRFILKGILKNSQQRNRENEKITLMARCDDCDEYVKFIESTGKRRLFS